ncbi:MAG: hypothetical protein WA364_23235 [Candidatus Nitrosopolaris sp.]
MLENHVYDGIDYQVTSFQILTSPHPSSSINGIWVLSDHPYDNGDDRPYCNTYDISLSSLYPESHRLLHLQPDVISSLSLALIESKNSGCKS